MQQPQALFLQFVAFLKKPTYKPEKIATKEKLKNLFWIWLLNLVVTIPPLCILFFLDSQKLIPESSYEFKDTTLEFVAMVVIAPIIEELFFRKPLNSPKWSVGVVGLFILWVVAQGAIFLGFKEKDYLYAGLFILWTFAWSSYKPSRKFYIYWTQNYQLIFYSSALFFGVIHLFNYKLDNAFWWVLPFLCVSQTIGGVFLGFIRLRYGLQFSMLLHGLFNFTVFLLSLLG